MPSVRLLRQAAPNLHPPNLSARRDANDANPTPNIRSAPVGARSATRSAPQTEVKHDMCTTCAQHVFHMCFTVVELLKHGDRSLEYTRITRRIHEKCSETSGNRIGCLEANALQFRRRSRPHRPWFLPLKM